MHDLARCYPGAVSRLAFRLHEIIERQGISLDLAADCCRLPRKELLRLMQPVPPRQVRLAVLDRLCLGLGVEPSALWGPIDRSLAMTVRVTSGESFEDQLFAEDLGADLEAAWARDFPVRARSEDGARKKWPFLFEGEPER